MKALLALFLVVGLPRAETNVTVSGRQNVAMRCYVCETENNFLCTQESNCTRGSRFCTTVAVRVFPRFYLVSKQCVAACAFEGVQQRGAKSFLLIKPTPFLYVVCCQERLCNTHNPVIEENSEDKYKEVAGACDGLGGRVGLAALLTLASVLLDLWLP
ncbi:lymphocyte antigen 6K [Sus scrofa]|uniref:Lymphocyte antigen 6 family member K n=2 Tax=Sus scrofa TaxID=9823 RepID=A0A4X1UTL0_PIG|nr:lymphocyte antigen 6K [Sus scrofa]